MADLLKKLDCSNAIKWWLTGLGYAFPASLRSRLIKPKTLITIELKDKLFVLKRHVEDSSSPLEIKQFDLDNEIEKKKQIDWIKSKLQEKTNVILTVPDEFFLKKKMSFPKAASQDLRQILSFEMNRRTPFSPEQVYFDYLQFSENEEKDKINVEVFIIPRNRIDNSLELITSWDIQLDAIRPISMQENPAINLILPADQPNKNIESDKTLLFLFSVTFVLFITFLYIPIVNQQKQINLLESAISKNRKAAVELKTLRQNKEKLLEQTQFLEKKRENEMSGIKLIHEVTQIIPDDTWLNRFVIKSGELQLQGESSNASSLIELLESSDHFIDVKFRSPITQNRASNKDKFHLSARLPQDET